MTLLRPYWERLLRSFATRRKNVVNLRELKRHIDVFALAEDVGYEPTEVLRDLLSGKVVEFDLSGKELDPTYKKIVKMLKDDASSVKLGKKLLFLGFPFLQALSEDVQVNGPILLFPLEGEVNPKLRTVKLYRKGEPIVNELLFVFVEKKLKRGFDEEGARQLRELPPEPSEALKKAKEVVERYLPLDGASGPEPFGGMKKGVWLRGFAIIGIFDVFSSHVLRDLNELVKRDPESLNLLLDPNFRSQYVPVEPLSERERFYPLPYDRSQHLAISAAVRGDWKVTILQGPPGTGKSQTIANLVAQLVSNGKKVLVVCRKKAALDVLHKRLNAARVSHVYVWDPSQDKREAFADLANCLTASPPPPEDALSPKIEELESKLNLVRRELTKKRACGLSLQELYALGSRKRATLDPRAKRVLTSFTYDEFERLLTKLKDVHGLRHAKAEFRKDWSEASLYDKDVALRAIDELNFIDPKDLKVLVRASKSKLLLRDETELKEMLNDLEFMLNKLEMWKNDIVEIDKELIKHYIEKRKSFLKVLDSKFRRAKDYVERLGKELKSSPEELLKLAELLDDYGANSSPLREAKSFLEGMKERVILSLEYFKLSKKYGDVIHDVPKEYVEVLDKLFHLENGDYRAMKEALEDFEKLKYYDVLRKELDERARELLDLVVEYDPETLRNTYAYAWIAEVERLPEVSKAIAYMKEYDNIMREYIELRRAKLEWSKLKAEHASKRDDPLMLEEVEKARKRGLRVSTFVRPRAFEILERAKVWLTSPEGACELFPLVENLFDYVIIDEASQMDVEYALPVIYRARKVVVVGDEKQLPPRLGFGQQEGPESVLELVRGRFPSFMLKTHFRSEYEELIAFSNYAFYDGQMAYPPDKERAKPLIYVKVNGVWRDGANVEEAKKVVEIIKEILEKEPETSIGVIAFNLKQKELIVSMLEEEAKRDKNFAKLYEAALTLKKDGVDQGLIVENIENIQGDERDVIIFSLVHAPDEEGKLRVHFGSLNVAGGERRLNVAITRAKKRAYLVTSLEPEDLGEPKASGVKLLKEYMKYVKYVHEDKKDLAKEVLSSLGRGGVVKLAGPVEERLAKELGLALDVGTSKFGLPAAKEGEGGYSWGLETDESVFRLTEDPLEEATRATALEGRGWKVVRVWTRDLWYDEDSVIAKLKALG